MTTYEFGPMRLDVEQHALSCEGAAVPLPPRLFQILLTLLEADGKLVPQEALRARVWPDSFVEDAAVSKNVSSLRVLLRGCLGDVEVIGTVPKRGYQFLLPVSVFAREEPEPPEKPISTLPPVEVAEPSSAPLLSVTPADRQPDGQVRRFSVRGVSGWRLTVGSAVLAVFIVAAAVVGYRSLRPNVAAPFPNGPPSFAILHLRNLSGDPAKRWMGVALGESLSNDLSRGNGLRLTSASDVAEAERDLQTTDDQAFDQTTIDALSKRLSSDLIVTGTYLAEGDHVRLDLQMRNVRTGELTVQYGQVAAQSNLQQLVADASREIRVALHLRSLSPSLTDPSLALASNADGLHSLAEGLRLYRSGETVAAKPLLEAAVAASPNAPLALVALARDDRTLNLDLEAAANARLALAASHGLPMEQKLLVDTQSYEALRDFSKASTAAEQLHALAPANVDYIYALAYTYIEGTKPDKALQALRLLPASAVSPTPSALLPLYQAYAARDRADYRAQMLRGGEAVKLAEAQGRRGTLARALLLQGQAWLRLGDNPHALADARRAEQVAADRKDLQTVSAALLQQGNVLRVMSDPAMLPTFLHALSIAQQGGARGNEAALLISIGNVYYDRADFPQAIDFFRKAVDLNRQIKNVGNEQIALSNLANAELTTQPEQSLRDGQDALAIALRTNNKDSQAQAWWAIGTSELQLGHTKAARTDFSQALTLAKAVGRPATVAEILRDMSILETKCGNVPLARSLSTQADEQHSLTAASADLQTIAKANLAIQSGDSPTVSGLLSGLLNKTHEATIASRAEAVLADSLLRQNKVLEARAAIDRAVYYTKSLPGDLNGNAHVLLLNARVTAAEGNLPTASASLRKLASDAEGWKDAWLRGEISIAQAEVDRQQGKSVQARAQFLSVMHESSRLGFGQLAALSSDAMRH